MCYVTTCILHVYVNAHCLKLNDCFAALSRVREDTLDKPKT